MFIPVPVLDDDFLSSWGIIERARLFDEKWRMSSQWLKFDPTGKPGHTWSHGDVSCKQKVFSGRNEVSQRALVA